MNDDWLELFFAVGCMLVGLYPAFETYIRRKKQKRQALEHCRHLLEGVLQGHSDYITSAYVFLIQGGVMYVGDVYPKYLRGMSIQAKHDVIEKLLRNAEIKTKGKTSLVELVGSMNEVEVETITHIVMESGHVHWHTAHLNLPDAIILFSLKHPREA